MEIGRCPAKLVEDVQSDTAEEGCIIFTHMALHSPLFVGCDGIEYKFRAIKL